MEGERHLGALLQNMTPELQDGVFVFCCLSPAEAPPAALTPLMLFREREGITLIVRREEAEQAGLTYQFAARLITLSVHSALDAVGFLAAVTTALAAAGISVNAVSAFHHDHLFVPEAQAEQAMRVLQEVSRSAAGP
ncbi:ACT domain-containing protein [Bradyrhizobium sp. 83012]|uniref:ACT domain-containing protein n=1 Tax=Bradyrhizobium aeschynomenes TaxID=2734909 RepID=A0ABX2CMT3_9BRAD|nr:ACT domain-containing protein [Bradyrhizobium aeschynomenes]NPU68980.1 ACT domain-containing protein [Bradyrhizobium aeschynomenes]